MSPDATIVVADPDALLQPNVRRLREEEVRRVHLGSWESNGMLVVELWGIDRKLDGPFWGFVLGTP